MGLDHVLVNPLRQLIGGKGGEGPAERRFARHVGGAFPAAQATQRGPGAEGFNQGARGGELIDGLGDERVRQPDTRTGRTAVPAPLIAVGEAPQLRERNDFTKLLIQGGELPEFVGEGRKDLALQAVEDRREVEHVLQTNPPRTLFIRPRKNPNKIEF